MKEIITKYFNIFTSFSLGGLPGVDRREAGRQKKRQKSNENSVRKHFRCLLIESIETERFGNQMLEETFIFKLSLEL